MQAQFLAMVPRSGGAAGNPLGTAHPCRAEAAGRPTSLTAGAREAGRTDAFTNVVVADAPVQAVGTVFLAGRSPLLCGTRCGESRGAVGWHWSIRATCPRGTGRDSRVPPPQPHSPLTISL